MAELIDTKAEKIETRFSLPLDVHKKIISHKRKLSAVKDSDVTLEEALIDFIRNARIR